jgi:hypothetical protein
MARKHKPEPDLVDKAAEALKNPKAASPRTIQRMAAVLLDDQEFALQPHRPRPKPGWAKGPNHGAEIKTFGSIGTKPSE